MDYDERLARLEEQINTFKENQKELLSEVKSLRSDLSRYKGFIGGVVFVISGVVTLIGLAIQYFHK